MRIVAGWAGLALALVVGSVGAQEPVKVRMANLGFPAHAGLILHLLKEKGFDRKHALDLELKPFGTISAYYGSVAAGEADGFGGGLLVFQKMRNEGVPIKVVGTMVDMTSLAVITKDPAIKTLADLKGKTIAADMGSAEYSVLSIYARSKGVNFGKDVTVVQAGPPLVRTQLAADRVEAGMTWEPTLTLTMRDNAAYRPIFNGKSAWREMTGKEGWLLVLAMREDWINKNPAAVTRFLSAFDETAKFMVSNSDEADKILQDKLKLPAGAFKDMISAPRVVFKIEAASNPSTRDALWETIKVAISENYFKEPIKDQSLLHTR